MIDATFSRSSATKMISQSRETLPDSQIPILSWSWSSILFLSTLQSMQATCPSGWLDLVLKPELALWPLRLSNKCSRPKTVISSLILKIWNKSIPPSSGPFYDAAGCASAISKGNCHAVFPGQGVPFPMSSCTSVLCGSCSIEVIRPWAPWPLPSRHSRVTFICALSLTPDALRSMCFLIKIVIFNTAFKLSKGNTWGQLRDWSGPEFQNRPITHTIHYNWRSK